MVTLYHASLFMTVITIQLGQYRMCFGTHQRYGSQHAHG